MLFYTIHKGVELIHSNQVSNIKAGRNMVVDPADFVHSKDRSLAFLPWAHSYGQVSFVPLLYPESFSYLDVIT